MTQVALSHIQHFHKQAIDGRLSLKDAQKNALEDIRNFRYGPKGKDYFWINSMGTIMLMHPYRKDLEGNELSALTDSNGKRFFLEFTRVVRLQNSGFVDYMWQWQDNPSLIIEKISYVEGFKPWGWIVGTGMYLDDIRRDLAKLTRHILIIIFMILSIIVVLLLYIVHKASLANKSHLQAVAAKQQSESRFRELADLLPEGIFECDTDYILTYANNKALEMFGYTIEDIANGLSCMAIFSISDQELAQINAKRTCSGEDTGASEYLGHRKDKSTFPILLHASCIYQNDIPTGLRGIIIDISKQKQIEAELIRHRHNLEELVTERTRELKEALDEVNILTGLLPICTKCKKIRDDKGFWNQVETYIEDHSTAYFSHSLCPICEVELYGKEEWYKKAKKR